MTLDHKRSAVEVLLCTASVGVGGSIGASINSTYDVGRDLGSTMIPLGIAGDAWLVVARDLGVLAHADVCLEAAYRLVETSADLRREWFGR